MSDSQAQRSKGKQIVGYCILALVAMFMVGVPSYFAYKMGSLGTLLLFYVGGFGLTGLLVLGAYLII